jgi:hypothetical protein
VFVPRLIVGALCTAAIVVPVPAATAEISFQEGTGIFEGITFIDIAGEIGPDDGHRFEEIARKITGNPKLVSVTLSGPGGDLIAGLRIGTVIHDRGWSTVIGANSTCDSTCGYIWIAGLTRVATKSSHILQSKLQPT